MTEQEAKNLAFKHILDAALLFGLNKQSQMLWPDRPAEPPPGQAWIKSWFEIDDREQVAFGGPGRRRFENRGRITIMCYAPIGDGNVLVASLGQHMLNELEKVRSDQIWYGNIRAVPAPNEGSFSRRDVKLRFRFDQFN